MKLSISELLAQCSKLGSTAERIAFLQYHDTPTMRAILQYALDPRVEWLLPKGVPPYKPCEFLDQEARLFQEIRKINLFVKGGEHPNMHPTKREQLFIQFIEGLCPDDAKLICSVKDKKIPYKGITASLVNAAYPGLVLEQKKESKEK